MESTSVEISCSALPFSASTFHRGNAEYQGRLILFIRLMPLIQGHIWRSNAPLYGTFFLSYSISRKQKHSFLMVSKNGNENYLSVG